MWANIISQRTIFMTPGIVTWNARIDRVSSVRHLLSCPVRNVATDPGRTLVSANQLNKSRYEENGTGTVPQFWLIFPGLGAQCNAVPKELHNIEPFAESLNKSRKILQRIGIDIDELLHPDNPSIFKCIRSGLLSLTVLQIALCDTIKHVLPSDPSGIIGHSAGENVCSYADGCLSAEQVILLSDACARSILATKKMPGGMAIVGLPWEAIQTFCPPDIYFSGDNSQNIIMISGPSESLKSFAKELTEKRIFVRLLDTCEIAPHSPYMAEAGVLLRKYAKEVIPNKTLRSSKWISTSVSEEDWDSPEAQYLNDIYVENLLNNQVRFYQASLHIPNNSVVIEVSPKATLGIFVEETVPSVRYLPCVLKKNEINPAMFSKENFKSLLRRENYSTF